MTTYDVMVQASQLEQLDKLKDEYRVLLRELNGVTAKANSSNQYAGAKGVKIYRMQLLLAMDDVIVEYNRIKESL